jgi:hypothetical protein
MNSSFSTFENTKELRNQSLSVPVTFEFLNYGKQNECDNHYKEFPTEHTQLQAHLFLVGSALSTFLFMQ